MRRHSLSTRIVALVLSWTVPGSSAWALVPPPADAGPHPGPLTTAPTPSWLAASETVPPARPADLPANPTPADLTPLDEDAAPAARIDVKGESGAECTTAAVRPILECVEELGNGQYRAHFGYSSDNTQPVTIPLGSKNKFTPSPQDRGQPTTFQPGRTPFYPQAAFQAPFGGSNLVWTLKGPDGSTRTSTASSGSARCVVPAPACENLFFGPQRFDRTTGPPNEYDRVVAVPAGAGEPFTLRVTNGAPGGQNRVSSAEISLDGVMVVRPSDLDQNTAFVWKTVSLQRPQSVLHVRLASAPGSYLTIEICGANVVGDDTTPPDVAVPEPAQGALIGTRTPRLRVAYQDAGGLDLSSLQVLLDAQDRTALFSVGAGEAVADLPADLALVDGPHTLQASLRDVAGNLGQGQSGFTVDGSAPTLAIQEPSAGAWLGTTAPAARVGYADTQGLALGSFRATVDGADRTADFTVGASEATATLAGLSEGSHTLGVEIVDLAGHRAETSATFQVDVTPPALSIGSPAAGAWLTSATPGLAVSWSDAGSGVLASSFAFELDGSDRTAWLTAQASGATGAVPASDALAEGAHTAAARVRDRAGNEASVTGHAFSVDTLPPALGFEVPSEGAYLGALPVAVRLGYSDGGSGLDLTTLVVTVDGTDRTALFTSGPAQATAELGMGVLGEGLHLLVARVKDVAGHLTSVERRFTLDTQAPVVAISTPAEDSYHKQNPVELTGSVTDDDPQVAVTCRLGTTTAAANVHAGQFTCSLALAEGENLVEVEAADRLGRPGSATRRLRLDTHPPELQVLDPVEGQLVSGQPLTVSGSVEDASPVTVSVAGLAADVQGHTFTASGVPVGAGPHVTLEVVAEDAAGNTTTVPRSVTVDDQPPTVTITSPADGAVVRGPTVEVRGSAQDGGPVTVQVNGQPATLDCGAGFTGELPAQADRRGRLRAVGGTCTFTVQVPVSEGTTTLQATALDGAGNPASDSVDVVVDSVAPVIVLSEPTVAVLDAESVRVAGTVVDDSPVTLTLDGQAVAVVNGAFSVDVPTPNETGYSLVLVARDAADNSSQKPVAFAIDRTPPTASLIEPAEGAMVGSLPLIVRGLASDATALTVTVDGQPAVSTQNAWEAQLVTLGEGSQTLQVVISDAAQHSLTLTREVRVDLAPPSIEITSPQNGFLTRLGSVTVSGNVVDQQAPAVTVGDVTAVVTWGPGGGTFTAEVPLAEGDATLVARAADELGRSASDQVVVTRDSTPPQVTLVAPDRLRRGATAEAVATVSDASAVTSVVMTLQGQVLGSFGAPPYVASFGVPAGAANGDPLALEAVALDAAGNQGQAALSVRVVGGGVVVGQVLDDATGLPLAGATVRLFAGADLVGEQVSDERGRYSFEVSSDTALLRVDLAEHARVLRDVTVDDGTGTVAIDARLQALGEAVTVEPGGGTLSAPLRIVLPSQPGAGPSAGLRLGAPGPEASSGAGRPRGPSGAELIARRYAQVRAATSAPITVEFPAGAVSTSTPFRLTSLSAQGLPGLLPLGWSPLVALDLRSEGAGPLLPLSLTATGLPVPGPALLVEFREAVRGWAVLTQDVPVVDGAVTLELPATGVFALVVPDAGEPAVPVPALGALLSGVPSQAVPATATASSVVEPAVVPPSGETALGSVVLQSPTALPSGTVVSAEVAERYELSNGQVATEERRLEDLLLYRQPAPAGGSLGATLPVRASRTFELSELTSGLVRVTVLSGREGARGGVGGSDATVVENGGVRLSVAAGALGQNTALSVSEVLVGDDVPSGAGLAALHVVEADFSGLTLGIPAELSVVSSAAGPDDVLVYAQLVRVDGVVQAEVVALGVLVGGRVVSTAYPGLRGVRQGGRYVVYRLTSQPGFVSGVTRAQENGLPVQAVVVSDGLPFVGQAGGDGAYVVATASGTVNLTARVPGTSLLGTGTAAVSAGQTSTLDLSLLGSVSTALVRPPDGAVNVATGAQVEIEVPVALDPGSVTDGGVQLLKVEGAGETPVAVRRVLSASRRLLAVIPAEALGFDSLYRLRVTGLTDAVGGAVSVPVSTFRTQTDMPPQYDLTKLVITIPDENGLVHVSAEAGTLMPGTRVLIINAGNGVVVSFTADNDGALQGEFPASVEDRLLITITDPLGHVVNVERSQYFDPATGLTTLGVGGGEIGDPDVPDARVAIPAGALDTPVRLKVTHVGPEVVPEDRRPQMGAGAVLASGLRLESPEKPDFKKGLKLRFPRPAAAPEGATFFVLRQVSGPDGITAYEAVAEAVPVAPTTPLNGGFAPRHPEATSSNWEPKGLPVASGHAPSTAPNPVEIQEMELSSAWNSFMGTVAGNGVVQNTSTNTALLMYHYREVLPGGTLPGAITGKVLQAQWSVPGQPVTYKPAVGALVVGRDAGGQQFLSDLGLFSRVDERADGDGHFLLWDLSYTGGPVAVTAQYGGQTRTATAFQVDPASTHSYLIGRYSQTSATIVFPATEPPPPPPAARVRLYKLLENDQRQEILNGLVPEDEPILIGVTPERPASLPPGDPLPYDVGTQGVEIQGSNQGLQVERDPLGQTSPNHALANRWLVKDTTRQDGLYVPANPGTYTVRVKLDPANPQASPVYVSYVFRVLGAGGGVTTDPDHPPQVLAQQTRPKAGATGVPVEVYPQIAFSEPVKKARSAVSLKNAAGEEVAVRLLGVNAQGPVEDVTDQSEVTAVTVQPLSALEYGKPYSLQVGTVLEDLDPTPKSLPTVYTSGFTTFRPGDLEPESGQESIAGLAVLEDRAYVAQTHYRGGIIGGQVYQNGTLVTLDISDPTLLSLDDPQIRKGEHRIPSPPSDLTLDAEHKLVAVSAGPQLAYVPNPDGYYEVWSSPSNVYVYGVETDQPEMRGVVSFTTGLLDGQVQRVVLHGSRIYTTTHRKGLQLVDVSVATSGFPVYDSQSWWSLWRTHLGLRGAGYKVEEVVTIPVLPATEACQAVPPAPTCAAIALNDLEVADLNWRGSVQTLMLTTGRADVGLLIADPAGVQVIRRMALPGFVWGEALGLATVNSKPLAVVGGTKQGGGGIVHVVDLSPLATDQALLVLGTLEVPASPSDILISGTTAIVATNTGTAYLVSLVDPAHPTLIGTISNVGSKIVLTDAGILLSTSRSYIENGNDPLRGLHAAAMQATALIKSADPMPVEQLGATTWRTTGDVKVDYALVPGGDPITSNQVDILKNSAVVDTVQGSCSGSGACSAIWPEGQTVDLNASYFAQAQIQAETAGVLVSARKRIYPLLVDVDVDSDNNNGLTDPARTSAEEQIEDVQGDVAKPGKVIFVSDGDTDGDLVPDFADGIDLYGQFKEKANGHFTPLILELPQGLDLNQARVKFSYSASNPSLVQRQGSQASGYTYIAPSGVMRLWTRDGTSGRKVAPLSSGGDFVAPGEEYSVQQLGTAIRARTWRFYVEGIDYSRQTAGEEIKVEALFPRVSGPDLRTSDAVRVTLLQMRFVQPDLENHIAPASGVGFSHPSPIVAVTDSRITNIRLSEDSTRILADVVLAGRISCAVCDYTPGDLGRIDTVRVFVNDTTSPLASLAVNGPKAAEAPSLLKPFAFSGAFAGVLPGVELQRGPNLIRVDAADKVLGVTGFAELSIPVNGTEPPPVNVDYRIALDFGGVGSLAELAPDTPVHLTVVDRARTPEAYFEGDIFKTSDQPLVLSSPDATVTIADPSQVEVGLSPGVIGAIDAGVLVPSLLPAVLGYRLNETSASSGLFLRALTHVELTLGGELSESVPDSIEALADNGLVSSTQTLTETGNATRTFVSVDGTFSVLIPAEQPHLVAGWLRTSVSNDVLGVSSLVLDLREVAPASGTFITDQATEVGADQRSSLAGWQFEPGEATQLGASMGGDFRPYLMQMLGPDEFLAQVSSIQTADGPREVRKAFDGNYYVFMKHSPPGVYIWLPVSPGTVLTVPALPGNADASLAFLGGYIEGFLAGLVSLVEGVFQLGALALVENLRTLNPLGWVYVMTFGDRYETERQYARTAIDLATTLANLELRILADDQDLVFALAAGDYDGAEAISAPYALAYEFSVEFLQALGQQLQDSPPQTQGYILGRAVFEIAAIAAPFAKAGEAGQITKLGFINRLRAHPFFQDARLVGAFERVLGLRNELAVTRMCFVAGTKVSTDQGPKNIEEVRQGDLVLARDPYTGTQTYKAVLSTVVTHPSRLFHVLYRAREDHQRDGHPATDRGEDGEELAAVAELVSTGAHPFFVVERQDFVPAEELKLGQHLMLASGGLAEVVGLRSRDAGDSETFTTFNLEVDEFHTYFVGHDAVWVHNAGRAFCERLKALFELALKQRGQDVWAAHTRLGQRFDALVGRDSSLSRSGVARAEMYAEALRRHFGDIPTSATPPPWLSAGQRLTRTNPPFRTGAMAEELASNMDTVLGLGKPPGFAAHHLVPPGFNDAAGNAGRLRQLLAEHGVHLNEAGNGVYLPQFPTTAAQYPALGPLHNTLHTNKMMERLWIRLSGVENPNRARLLEALQKAARDIIDRTLVP